MDKTKEEIIREKILVGAAQLFQKYGLEKTTIEDIAREAGKGKSTLYYYYKSKEEIFDAILQEEYKKFFNVLQQAVSEAPTAREKLNVFCRSRFENLKQWSNLYNVMVQECVEALRTQGSVSTPNRVLHDKKETSIIKSILQFGIISGEFKVFSDEELDMLSFVFLSSFHGLEMDLIIHQRIDEILENFDILEEMLLRGILK